MGTGGPCKLWVSEASPLLYYNVIPAGAKPLHFYSISLEFSSIVHRFRSNFTRFLLDFAPILPDFSSTLLQFYPSFTRFRLLFQASPDSNPENTGSSYWCGTMLH